MTSVYGDQTNKMFFFFKKCAPKHVPMLSVFRIDPVLLSRYAKANDK